MVDYGVQVVELFLGCTVPCFAAVCNVGHSITSLNLLVKSVGWPLRCFTTVCNIGHSITSPNPLVKSVGWPLRSLHGHIAKQFVF